MSHSIVIRIASIVQRLSDFFAASKGVFWLNKVLEVITHLGDGWIWISAYFVSFVFLKDHLLNIVLPVVAAEITGLLIIIPLRYGARRRRPDKTYKTNPYTPWNKYSFPSHHSLRSFIIAEVIGSQYAKAIAPLLILASVISLSRVCLAKHYLSDVLAGALIGGFLGVGFTSLFAWLGILG